MFIAGHDCQTKQSTIEDITKETGTSSTLSGNLKEESTDIEHSEELEKADRLQDIHLDENKQGMILGYLLESMRCAWIDD